MYCAFTPSGRPDWFDLAKQVLRRPSGLGALKDLSQPRLQVAFVNARHSQVSQ
jgi:hypothetical protein